MLLIADPPRYLFFTGKGGVGKTSIACATAVHLADAGRRVLLVSTDPASNVGHVFGLPIGNAITAIPDVPGLDALEIDPEQAAEAYRNRIIEPVRDLLPAQEIAAITEQLSGSCTTEVASFNEFTALLSGGSEYSAYDHIVFDTAPTGHTIRLLQLPGSWTGFLDGGKGDASCLGPLAGLTERRSQYARAVAALQDPELTRLVLVTRPQVSAIEEVERTYEELALIGIHATNLVVNGVLPDAADAGALDEAIRRRERDVLGMLPPNVAALPRDVISLRSANIVSLSALRGLLSDEPGFDDGLPVAMFTPPDASLAALIDGLEGDGHGLVLCMGKGGVGKTTVAASIAVALARRGHDVHLTTTDPAAHLHDVLPAQIPNLRVSRIDPVEATRAYRERVMTTKGKNLDADGKAQLAEDLLSPCTEEIAVFQQFSRVVLEGRRRFVVVDTAPTGHTLLLLDTAGAYHRDMVRQSGDAMTFHTPLMLLQDPELTRVLIVTTAEPTPVAEAAGLQEDLLRAGIRPWAWVINGSIAAARPTSRLLQQRAATEAPQYEAIAGLSPRIAAIPLLAEEPIGEQALLELSSMVGSAS
ncbi:MAG: arsenical pump-driving ATPase [Candidatus Nanopelagicales bacterium]|nr:arsenical pump-driving ATPase [Candidatus Nanopelagicales bacterium]